MNDIELNRLLDTWETPAPAPSLRERLRVEFPRPERKLLTRPLRWGLAIAVASVTLALAVGQTSDSSWNSRVLGAAFQIYESFLDAVAAWRVTSLMAHIRQSEPRVYVDGQPATPLMFGTAATMDVQVPGDGVYSIILFRRPPSGWTEAGYVRDNVIEFQAGDRRVRIECNKPIANAELPVFVIRR